MKTLTCLKLIVAGALLLAVGLAFREVRRATSPQAVRRELQEEFREALRGDLSLRSASFQLNGTLQAEDLDIRAPGREVPLFQCPRVIAEFDWWQLLHLRNVVRRVVLVRPTFRLFHEPGDQRWNFQNLVRRPAEPGAPPAATLAEGIALEDATFLVKTAQLFKDGEPRAFEGLQFRLVPQGDGLSVWRFEGRVQRGPLRGLELRGFFSAGESPGLHLKLSAADLAADERFWNWIPYGKAIWRDFRPEGPLAVTGTVDWQKGGRVDYRLALEARGMSLKTKYLPAQAESVRGTVTITPDGLTISNTVGEVPPDQMGAEGEDVPPAEVRLDGTQRWDGAGRYSIRARDVPLRRTTIESIPAAGGKLWKRLRPHGRCRLELTMHRPQRDAEMGFRLRANLSDTSLNPPELPGSLEEVAGLVLVDNQTATFRGLQGKLRRNGAAPETSAEVEMNGRMGLADGALDLNVHLRNVRTDEELVKAIPARGERIWEMLRPELLVDGRLSLRRAGGEEDYEHSGLLRFHGGKAQLKQWPMPLRRVSGTVRVENSRFLLERVSAVAGTGPVDHTAGATLRAAGYVDLEAGRAEVNVSAGDLSLGEALLSSIPAVGQQIWRGVKPEGPASMNGTLSYRADQEHPLSFLLHARLHDVTARPQALPFALKGLRSEFLVREGEAFTDRFSALACGGHLRGSAVFHYGTPQEQPTYAGTVEFRHIDLADLAGRYRDESPRVEGQLAGTVDFGGVLDTEAELTLEGEVSLSEGRLWNTTFFSRLMNLLHLTIPGKDVGLQRGRGRFRYLAGRTEIQEFELTGGGLDLSGYGTVSAEGDLDLLMVAAGMPEQGRGIPILSSLVGWVMRGMERELFRIKVTGTLQNPNFAPETLARILWPLTNLRSVLFSPTYETQTPRER